MRVGLSFLTALLLAGVGACSSEGGPRDAKLRQSPNFQQGYEDGCASANEEGADFRGRLVQDPTLYKADAAYRTGWSNGFRNCRTSNAPPGTPPGSNPLGGPLPGTH